MTMELKLIRRHLSLRALPDTILPSLVIITGVNGAGKTHLLQAIKEGSVRVDIAPNPKLDVRYYDYRSFAAGDAGESTTTQLYADRDAILNNVRDTRNEFSHQINEAISQLGPEQWNGDVWEFARLPLPAVIHASRDEEVGRRAHAKLQAIVREASTKLINKLNAQSEPGQRAVRLSQTYNGQVILLERDDFRGDHFGFGSTQFLQHSFGRLFLAYFELEKLNRLYQLEVFDGRTPSEQPLDDKTFRERHGTPPWEFVNRTLANAGLQFRIDQPAGWETTQYTPRLTKVASDVTMPFSALSSGEKVLMALALCVFYATDRRQSMVKPKLLLLDEVDAPLHPSMSRQLIRTVAQTLVDEEGIPVIMTTHSASTIAVAPEDAVFAMRPETPGLIKVTRTEALAILTEELPILSITFDGRRQVFTESDADAERYESIYRILKPSIGHDRSLVFIGAGRRPESGPDQAAGCAQVTKVVSQLATGGNVTVFGLVDWDLTRTPSARIHVLGHKERYAIENCLLDPLMVAAAILRENQKLAKSIGLSDTDTYLTLPGLTADRLQVVADQVQKAVLETINLERLTTVKYLGDFTLDLSEGYLQMNGHELESAVKRAFPVLKRLHQTGALLKHIVDPLMREVPRFVPTVLRDALVSLLRAAP